MSPLLRHLLGAPRHLYRHGWGWLLGQRFLQLSHHGRRTGKQYHTVLEVVRYDPLTGEATVAAGFGEQSDWLRNLQAGSDYERRNVVLRPVVRTVLSRLLGWRYDGTDAARRRLAEELPMVALRPARRPGVG